MTDIAQDTVETAEAAATGAATGAATDVAEATDEAVCHTTGEPAPVGCDGAGGCGSGTGCGGHDHGAGGIPVLDARSINPMIRQSAIFGVLVGMPPGAGVVIVTPSDPAPIVDLLHERLPGEYSVETSQTGDAEAFQVLFTRM